MNGPVHITADLIARRDRHVTRQRGGKNAPGRAFCAHGDLATEGGAALTQVLLFGAGASKGCGDVYPYPPPLGFEPYEALRVSCPRSWGALPAELDQMFRDDFETAMEKLWHDSSQVVPTLMQQMALYFNEFSPEASGTHYGRLVSALRAAGRLSETLFSTLNYENILEMELAQRGAVRLTMEFPAPDGSATVHKLHGSCNYVPDDGIRVSRSAVRFTSAVTFPSMKVLSTQDEVRRWMLDPDNGLPPAMCLYMKEKPIQAGGAVIAAMQQSWRDAIAQAGKVVIIGVRPNPHDVHLWDAIADTPATVCYVGDAATFTEWSSKHRGGRRTEVLGDRFHSALESIIHALT